MLSFPVFRFEADKPFRMDFGNTLLAEEKYAKSRYNSAVEPDISQRSSGVEQLSCNPDGCRVVGSRLRLV